MKKLAVVAFALVIAMSFVGCGLANQLSGTKWEIRETVEYEGIPMSYFVSFEFKADNEFVLTEGAEAAGEVESYSLTGTWSVEGDKLTMEIAGSVMECTAEIDGDTLTLTDETGVTKLTRVK
jgi:hypothetical protein